MSGLLTFGVVFGLGLVATGIFELAIRQAIWPGGTLRRDDASKAYWIVVGGKLGIGAVVLCLTVYGLALV